MNDAASSTEKQCVSLILLEKQAHYIAEMSSFHHAFDNRLCAQFLASTVAAHWRNALPLPAAVALWTEPLQPTRALPVSLSGVAWPVRWVGISKIVNTFFFFFYNRILHLTDHFLFYYPAIFHHALFPPRFLATVAGERSHLDIIHHHGISSALWLHGWLFALQAVVSR